MIRRGLKILCLVAIGLGVQSCQSLRETQPFSAGGRGELATERVPFTDAIPAEFGDIVGVAANPEYAAWTQVWFVKPDKSLAVLWVNAGNGRIYERMLVIPRR